MWSATGFDDPELDLYAEEQIRADTRRGVQLVAGGVYLHRVRTALCEALERDGPFWLGGCVQGAGGVLVKGGRDHAPPLAGLPRAFGRKRGEGIRAVQNS